MWMALIAALLGAGGNILGSVLQNNRAKDLIGEAQGDKAYGQAGMERLLGERQTAYNNVWKMIYGGVEGFDFSSPPGVSIGERSGNRQGATDSGSGGAPPTEKQPQGKGAQEKDRDWWTQHRLPHESELY